jgi:tetratricopeptide (TPR) repeat protein
MTETINGKEPSGASGMIKQAYDFLKKEDLAAAQESLDAALRMDFDNQEVIFAQKCAGFWLDRVLRAQSMQNQFERGEFLLSQWKSFVGYLKRLDEDYADAVYAFRQYIFSFALRSFLSIASDAADANEADLSLRIGRCHKGRGEFEIAIKHLESALQARKDDAEILGELADAYAQVNETRTAKALFREAFFLNAQKVDVEALESVLIRRLVDKVSERGFSGQELSEWLPVYGLLLGVMNVKRELRPIEVGKLKQSIYQLENEVKDPGKSRALVLPRLLNRYFWLIDHYVASREDRSKIDETLLKIKLLDSSIHQLYTS